MKRITTMFFITAFSLLYAGNIWAQNRPMYAAGRFYEADSIKLLQDLHYLFSKAKNYHLKHILAVISPHAGYAYSGQVAATSFAQLNPNKKYDNIFLIGSSHTMYLNGASVYSGGDYLTPLGKIQVNIKLAKQLIKNNKYITFVPQAHLHEHSLENQLPFLQYHIKKPFKIVPIIIGTEDKKILQSLAETLKPWFNEKNLFIISSDFSHYPKYHDAQKADSLTASSIVKNNVNTFIKALQTNAYTHYPGLVTSACGHTSIETLLYITQNMKHIKIIPLKYMNSGDTPIGDKNRVVGYFSLIVVKNSNSNSNTNNILNDKDKKTLLNIARKTLETEIVSGHYPKLNTGLLSNNIKIKSGAFVTLNENGQLRGCIGRFVTDKPLYKTVENMTVAAATQDYRFPPVTSSELNRITIEISVLTPLKKVNSIDDIVLGRDGIYLVKGDKHGTFLPQVATETGWTKEEFLGHCAQDKAGLKWNDWKTADIYTYRAIVFSEKDFNKKQQ